MNIHPAIRDNVVTIARFGLGFTAMFAGATIFIAAVAFPPLRPACAIEVTMADGNVYRPSVADTCKEAWQGFNINSIAGRDYVQVVAVAFDE